VVVVWCGVWRVARRSSRSSSSSSSSAGRRRVVVAHRQLLQKARQLLSASTCKLTSAVVKTTEPLARLSVPTAVGRSLCSRYSLPEVALHETPSASGHLSVLPAYRGQLRSPSSPNSVLDHKKTSLSGWLPLPRVHFLSPHRSFSPVYLTFLLRAPLSGRLFNLQVASIRLSPTQNCVAAP